MTDTFCSRGSECAGSVVRSESLVWQEFDARASNESVLRGAEAWWQPPEVLAGVLGRQEESEQRAEQIGATARQRAKANTKARGMKVLARMGLLYAGWKRRAERICRKVSREKHALRGGLGALQEAGADGGELGDEGLGVAAREGGGVNFGGEKNGSGYVGAAFQAIFFEPAGQIK